MKRRVATKQKNYTAIYYIGKTPKSVKTTNENLTKVKKKCSNAVEQFREEANRSRGIRNVVKKSTYKIKNLEAGKKCSQLKG